LQYGCQHSNCLAICCNTIYTDILICLKVRELRN
jgi:hypothetical protein